jgi:hypothetical protein
MRKGMWEWETQTCDVSMILRGGGTATMRRRMPKGTRRSVDGDCGVD